MSLTRVHQLLIIGAIGLSLIFGLRSLWLFSRGQGSVEIAIALGGFAVAGALGLYLKRFRAKVRASEGGRR